MRSFSKPLTWAKTHSCVSSLWLSLARTILANSDVQTAFPKDKVALLPRLEQFEGDLLTIAEQLGLVASPGFELETQALEVQK